MRHAPCVETHLESHLRTDDKRLQTSTECRLAAQVEVDGMEGTLKQGLIPVRSCVIKRPDDGRLQRHRS